MEPVVARKMWRTLEPYHGLIYFAPEPREAYRDLGIGDRMMGYFASRAAPMGAVSAEVVIATFFNFHPDMVRERFPAAWEITTPQMLTAARFEAADAMLRRVLGDVDVREAASLARTATDACTPEGRPLYAGHASLDWPDEPNLVLWHAISLLREFRGDGHIAAMTVEGLDGCEALVTHAAAGDVPREALQTSRRWPDEQWDAAADRLRVRGLVEADGSFTTAGQQLRQRIEDRTDELALRPWEAIGEDACSRLRELVRPLSKAIVASGELTFR